ncbi:MAG: transforming growth factor-beta-induced protein, partial [Bacillariaceae sp.]|jgi:transforming growth factor-beta-induced protein
VVCDTDQPFSVLCKLLTEYNLIDALSSGKWTVFAPTDEAFANVSDILSNLDDRRIEQVLLFHTVKDTIIETFSCKEVITMTNGKDSRALCGDNGELFFKGADNSNDALPELVSAVVDDSICNGVIYVMDNVMLPSNTLPDVA